MSNDPLAGARDPAYLFPSTRQIEADNRRAAAEAFSGLPSIALAVLAAAAWSAIAVMVFVYLVELNARLAACGGV